MTVTGRSLGLTLLVLGRSAFAAAPAAPAAPVEPVEPAPDVVAGGVVPRPRSAGLAPPVLLEAPALQLPPDLPIPSADFIVEIVIAVDAEGAVSAVRLISTPTAEQLPYSRAVVEMATRFHFEPATFNGEPVVVEIAYQQAFQAAPPPPRAGEPGPALRAKLSGVLVEKGTRTAVAYATVVCSSDGHDYTTSSDSTGAFALDLPEGIWRLEVVSAEHYPFRLEERLEVDEHLHVEYLLERTTYSPYETVVLGKRDRRVVGRTTLRAHELRKVPGTFGDPFRVVTTLPGVSQAFSLLPYPIVRGSSPGNSGFFMDGVRIPQLFHLLFAPAVIHPEMIERIDFYPGNFPVKYGGFIGGIVDGITKQSRPGDGRLDIDLDLTKVGVLARGPIPFLDDVRGTIAGRYGYPFLLLEALNVGVYLMYWDYQARLDGRAGPGRWQITTFGSYDELQQRSFATGPRTTVARTMFHRLDLTYQIDGDVRHLYKLVLGIDQTLAGETATLTSWVLEPRASWRTPLFAVPALEIEAGVEGSFRRFETSATFSNIGDVDAVTSLRAELGQVATYAELTWRLGDDLWLMPGVRGDFYVNRTTQQWSVDPRLIARYHLTELFEKEVWLKAGLGRYHQPPRFFIPIPGFEELALAEGLLASTQVSLGIELGVPLGFIVDAQVYFQDMNPVLFDLAVNASSDGIPPGRRDPDDPIVVDSSGGIFDGGDLLARRVGRSYGLEVLIKQEGSERFYGWLSYTLSWSERLNDRQWVPFDFDRRHVLNLVAGITLPRNWDMGVRLQVQSGRPYTDSRGFNAARTDPFVGVSLRIDKRAVWDRWLFDFYVDLINITLSPEQIDGRLPPVRIGVPSLGIRAVL